LGCGCDRHVVPDGLCAVGDGCGGPRRVRLLVMTKKKPSTALGQTAHFSRLKNDLQALSMSCGLLLFDEAAKRAGRDPCLNFQF